MTIVPLSSYIQDQHGDLHCSLCLSLMAASAPELPSPWLPLYAATGDVADFSPEDVLAVSKAPT